MTWAKFAILAVLLGIIAMLWVGNARIKTTLANERAAWAEERTKAAQKHAQAMQEEIEKHNSTLKQLEDAHAEANTLRQRFEDHAKTASVALAAANTSASRLRDAIETHRLATRAALESAGATGQCQASEAAADLLRQLFSRCDSIAGRIGEAARGISEFADRQTAAVSECARDYEVTR